MEALKPPSPVASAHNSPSPVRYLDTTAAYDLWSEVYDTDGNFLQALDTIEMKTLLPSFLSRISSPKPWTLVDLGCGTGRNTLPLLGVPESLIVGLDASPKMLEIAKARVDAALAHLEPHARPRTVQLDVFDLLANSVVPSCATGADAAISTLVLEHVPIDIYFRCAACLLKPGAVFLVTNMHSEMGGISQAGFVVPKTRQKIRPTSYAHRLDDVIAGAKQHGFDVIGEVRERGVDEQTNEALGSRANKWIGVMVWFGVCFRKKSNPQTIMQTSLNFCPGEPDEVVSRSIRDER
jgi:SAM-dependent methyltransferase